MIKLRTEDGAIPARLMFATFGRNGFLTIQGVDGSHTHQIFGHPCEMADRLRKLADEFEQSTRTVAGWNDS